MNATLARDDLPVIFLALERFDYYSIVLQSRLLPELARSWRVAVLTPTIDADEAERLGYFRHENVTYLKRPIEYPRLWSRSDRIRRYCVRTYDNFVTTHDAFYDFPRTRVERLFILLGRLCPKRLVTPWFFTAIERLIGRPSADFRDLVRAWRPRLMAVATPGYRNLPFTAEHIIFASRLGIPTVSVYSSFDNPYSMPKFLRPTDYIFVWNRTMKREVAKIHRYASERVFVVGSLRFDHHFRALRERRLRSRSEFLASKNLDPEKKTIVFCTTVPGFKCNRKLLTAIAGMKQSGLFAGDPNLFVRLHPHDKWASYERFRGIPGVHIERAGRLRDEAAFGPKVEMDDQDLLNQTETFFHADVIINFSSTTTLEACIVDTPVVSIGWMERLRRTYLIEITKNLVAAGAERHARSPEELAELVNEFLIHPEHDREKRAAVVKDYMTFDDGMAYRRTAEALAEIMETLSRESFRKPYERV